MSGRLVSLQGQTKPAPGPAKHARSSEARKLRYVALALVAVALAAPAAGTTKTGANEGKLTMIAWEGYLDAKWVKPFEQQSAARCRRSTPARRTRWSR